MTVQATPSTVHSERSRAWAARPTREATPIVSNTSSVRWG